MIKIPNWLYLIDEDEAKMINACLAYALHRYHCHPNSGIYKTGIKEEQIEKIINEFK